MGILAIALVWLGTSAFVQTFDAKVVGVSDGDTITVYDGREQTRIRLDGIDGPERGAHFSQRAKQFTSGLVFGKQVRIEGKERDRYGRLVAGRDRRVVGACRSGTRVAFQAVLSRPGDVPPNVELGVAVAP